MSGKHRASAARPLAQQAPNVSWTIGTYYTERLMSVKEVASSLGKSEWKVRKMVKDGELVPTLRGQKPGVRGRKGIWFTLSDIEHCRNGGGDHAR